MKKWKCTVCGYVHTGDEPPAQCPVCGADKSKFMLLEEETEAKPEIPEDSINEQQSSSDDQAEGSQKEKTEKKFIGKAIIDKYPEITQKMTQLHAHPVSVHIPNGVLPLSVIFTFIAAMFDSSAFATAAGINMLFIFLSMPFVLFSGYVDWINRYGGNMTKVFQIKMMCGAAVFLLTCILSVWWMMEPNILLQESGASSIFIFFHLLALVPAVTAGFYGGKLVFVK